MQMIKSSTTKAELSAEMSDLKKKIKKLGKSEAKRKQAEEVLKLNCERLAEAQRIAKIGDWEANLSTGELYWSQAIFDIFGFDSKSFKPSVKAFYEAVHPDDRDLVLESERRSEQTGLHDVVHRIIHANGEVRFVHELAKRYTDDQGKLFMLRGTVQDVSERKLAENALKKSEIWFRSLFEKASDGIFYLSLNGEFVDVNHAFASMHGYSVAEMRKMNLKDLDTPETSRQFTQRMRRVIAGEVLSFEVEHYHKDGHMFPLEVTTSIITVGNEKYVLAFHRDISERKQAEKEKRILEERLQHADKMEAIGTLAGGIAHDFNNLLMGIQGYASLSLLNLDPANPNYERLRQIEQQVQSGANLVSQLLGFARGGRFEVKPTDMNEIIATTSTMFGRTKKEISIHQKLGKDLWSVEVDRGQMEQVFLNLYVNAWQAMPGSGEVYLETENVFLHDVKVFPYLVKPGKYVKITVTDTGAGMDEKTRERIFDPFFTTKAMGRGTGLGLATVYGIIKGHQGMINVYSEPGQGTTFTIYLPASEKKVAKEESPSEKIVKGTETILLVEDEEMVLKVNKEMLEALGYRVHAVGSGQECIAVYAEKKDEINLVILDMVMPGISGAETFTRLREINSRLKVLLSSGYSLNGNAQAIMDRGCNGFLQKPFHLKQLSSKVRQILG
jgi:two-component system cell cycle sensor histidine kinase/response regulator CckA